MQEAVELAGPLPSADLNAMNLAALLQDGQRVPVPRVQPPQPEGTEQPQGSTSGAPDHRININTADRAQLEQLPGIGPALADRIIDYREQQGSFTSIDDLGNVSGIGAKRLEDLRDKVTVY